MKKEEQQPNETAGMIAVIVSIVVLAIDIFVPAREGAPLGSKFGLATCMLVLMSWGIRQVQSTRRKKKRDADAEKKRRNDT